MSSLPTFDPQTGLLPPGRYAVTLEELHEELVAHGSVVRRELWDEWVQHRAIVEAIAGEITRLWVGGSFVSGKTDPSDIDVTYLLRAEAYDRLDSEALADLDDLTLRAWCVEHHMRVDAHLIRLPEETPVSQMLPSLFSQRTSQSFRDLGLYDEVWQCTRPSSYTAGGLSEVRRGYVEVLL